MKSPNAYYLGDEVKVRLRHAWSDSNPWVGKITEFKGPIIFVENVNPSDDPMVSNSFWIGYGEICQ